MGKNIQFHKDTSVLLAIQFPLNKWKIKHLFSPRNGNMLSLFDAYNAFENEITFRKNGWGSNIFARIEVKNSKSLGNISICFEINYANPYTSVPHTHAHIRNPIFRCLEF